MALGTSVFGWTVDERTAFDLLDRFVERGFNLLDTADVYYLWAEGNKGGESETIIGNWLAARGRHRLVIATKVGEELDAERRGLSRRHIVASVEESLRRLQTDYIDLYQAHIDDPATPLEETLEAFRMLIEAGKVRVIGASNFERERLAGALALGSKTGLARYESFQTLYNLYDRSPFEKDLQPICLREEVGVLTYRSLARGFLTGKYRTPGNRIVSPRGNEAIAYLDQRGERILAALDAVAGPRGATPSQVALAWLIARPSVASAIASASNADQLGSLQDAAELRLSADDIAALDVASSAN